MAQLHWRHTLMMKAAQYIYIRRCIDSLLRTVKPIKWKNLACSGLQRSISTYRIYKNIAKYKIEYKNTSFIDLILIKVMNFQNDQFFLRYLIIIVIIFWLKFSEVFVFEPYNLNLVFITQILNSGLALSRFLKSSSLWVE